jgi:hypothetical protein
MHYFELNVMVCLEIVFAYCLLEDTAITSLLHTAIQGGLKDFSRHFYAYSWLPALLCSVLPLTLTTQVTASECCV